MADDSVTPREFDLLREMVQEGFEGTYKRLDAIDEKQRIANGRTSTLETALGKIGERLIAAERDVKRLVTNGSQRVRLATGVTVRDVKVAGIVLAAGGALVEYGPKVLKMLQAIGGTP
ncbi:MAG: hypothetical protein AB7P99_21210 [Vicinamibacterales bacterium]